MLNPGDIEAYLAESLRNPETHVFVMAAPMDTRACRACGRGMFLHPVHPNRVPHPIVLAYLEGLEK